MAMSNTTMSAAAAVHTHDEGPADGRCSDSGKASCLVQFRDVRGADEHWVRSRLELHLDADLRVADDQLGVWVLLLQREQRPQARGPARQGDHSHHPWCSSTRFC